MYIQGKNLTFFFLLGIFIFTSALLAASIYPTAVSAQYNRLEPRSEDDDNDSRWYRYQQRDNDDIDDLDDDIVENMPIPVLFGISLSDIYPSFGDPRDGGSRSHEGLDLLAPEWTPIVSPTEAVVTRVGEGSSSGIYVRTANPGGEQFVYMHLVAAADDLDRGDELAVGDLIGYVGETGNARGTTPHLHFEIRDGREVRDPYDRVTLEFSLEEKMEFLEDILDDADDSDDLVEFLTSQYSLTFSQARTEGLDVPDDVLDELPERATLSTNGRDLTVGSEGADVSALQTRLIVDGFLDISAPTGYFGPLTETALAAYQRAAGIQPASGYYGPITRNHLLDSATADTGIDSDYDLESMSRTELLDLVEELQSILIRLQDQLR